jgi:hypothetical protein
MYLLQSSCAKAQQPKKTSVRWLSCKLLPAEVSLFRAPTLSRLVFAPHVGCSNDLAPWIQSQIPNSQPLNLISKAGTSRLLSQHCSFSSYLDELSPDALETLIDTLSRFFSFAADFLPTSQTIGQTTHTSRYTYWFLVLSARILTERFSPKKCWPDIHIFYA